MVSLVRSACSSALVVAAMLGACACPHPAAEPPPTVTNAPPSPAPPAQAPELPPDHEVFTFWTLSDKVSYSVVLVVQRGAGKTCGSGTFTAFSDATPEAKAWGIVDARQEGPRAWSFTADMLDGKHRWSFALPGDMTPGSVRLVELKSDRAGPVELWCSYGHE